MTFSLWRYIFSFRSGLFSVFLVQVAEASPPNSSHWSNAWSSEGHRLLSAIWNLGCTCFDVLHSFPYRGKEWTLYTDLPPHTQNINTHIHTHTHTTQPPRPHLLGSVCVYHFPSFIHTHHVSQDSSFVLYRWRNIFIRWGQGSCHKRHRCLIETDAEPV